MKEFSERVCSLVNVKKKKPSRHDNLLWKIGWGDRNDVCRLTEWMHKDFLTDSEYPYSIRKNRKFLDLYRISPLWHRPSVSGKIGASPLVPAFFLEDDFPLFKYMNDNKLISNILFTKELGVVVE